MGQNSEKERIYLYAPNCCVSTVVTIEGAIKTESLCSAIKEAVMQNEILNTKLCLDKGGTVRFLPERNKALLIAVSGRCWQEIVRQQVKIRFAVENGEFIRFFIIPQKKGAQLLIMNHHIAGDGLSAAFLIEDIMNRLSGKEIGYKPVGLFKPDPFTIPSALPFFTRLMMHKLNREWDKSGTVFTFDDSRRLFDTYWKSRNINVFTQTIDHDILQKIYKLSKEYHITLNSLLMTAFYKYINPKDGIGITVDLRQNNYKGMGNYATGITVRYAYDHGKDFMENAVKVHHHIYQCLNDRKKKFFLVRFMGGLSGTLIDAAYFAAFDSYANSAAQMTSKLFGYTEEPKGTSVSNLTEIPIAVDYETCRLSDYLCIPPLVSNLRRVFGIATLGNTMSMTMCVGENKRIAEEKQLFENAAEWLKQLA